jgi:hypothetical protein
MIDKLNFEEMLIMVKVIKDLVSEIRTLELGIDALVKEKATYISDEMKAKFDSQILMKKETIARRIEMMRILS